MVTSTLRARLTDRDRADRVSWVYVKDYTKRELE